MRRPRGHTDTLFSQCHQESTSERGITKRLGGVSSLQARDGGRRSNLKAGSLTSMGVTEPCSNRGQVVLLHYQKLEGHNYHNDWQGHSYSQSSLTYEELWRQLIEYSLPGAK